LSNQKPTDTASDFKLMNKINTDKDKIEEILTRSVAEILPTKNGLREVLESGKRLRIYISVLTQQEHPCILGMLRIT